MKVFSIFRVLALAALMTVFSRERAGAQNLGLTISAAPRPAVVNSNLTYTIGFTNFTGINLGNTFVTNTLPATVTFLSAVVNIGVFTTNSSAVIFNVGPLSPGQGILILIFGNPTLAGSLTNTVDIFSGSLAGVVTTNVIVQATNAVPPHADLAVSVSGLPPDVLLNDWINYAVTVTNLGPTSATSVVLSNTFSSAVRLIGASPTNQAFTNTTFIFNLGTLAGGAGTKIKLTFEPTNSGTLTNTLFVGAAGISDTNLANNTAITNLTVVDRINGVLIATNLSAAMALNPQNGLMEQTIRLVNLSSSNAVSARVIAGGLTTNRLYNAGGTNSLGTLKPNPFVNYIAPLGPGQSVDLLMKYVVTNRLPFTVSDSNYFAYAMSPFIPTTTIDTNAQFISASIVLTPLGQVLVQFPSTPGRSYTIFYATNVLDFPIALPAQPDVTAQANITQWLDDGPPNTISRTSDTRSRFYRVRLNPQP